MEEEVNYLKEFDKIFKTNTSKRIELNMPLLKQIIQYFGEDIYTQTKKQDKLRDKKIQIYNKLKETLTEEQIQLFNQYNEIENQITQDTEEQLFMFGYLVSSELSKEIQDNITSITIC